MVTLIIVDYNTIEKTIEYLSENLSRFAAEDALHVVIVDNASDSVKNRELLQKLTGHSLALCTPAVKGRSVYKGTYQDQEYLYVAAEENLGYAKGNNLGAAAAKAYYPEDAYYLFSNNDLRLTDTFSLDKLLDPMKKYEDVAIVGPKVIGTDGLAQTPWKKTGAGKQLFLNYFDLLLPKPCKITKYITNLNIEKPDRNRYVYWVTGAFFLMDAKAFFQAGGFDEHTFLFYEEAILAERLLKIQKRVYYNMHVTVVHEHGQTVKKAWKVLQGITFSFESGLYYFREYCGLPYIAEILARLHFKIFKLLFTLKKKLKGKMNEG